MTQPDPLESLLGAPLDRVADDGFSAVLMTRILAEDIRRLRRNMAIAGAAILLFLAGLSGQIADVFNDLAEAATLSRPVLGPVVPDLAGLGSVAFGLLIAAVLYAATQLDEI